MRKAHINCIKCHIYIVIPFLLVYYVWNDYQNFLKMNPGIWKNSGISFFKKNLKENKTPQKSKTILDSRYNISYEPFYYNKTEKPFLDFRAPPNTTFQNAYVITLQSNPQRVSYVFDHLIKKQLPGAHVHWAQARSNVSAVYKSWVKQKYIDSIYAQKIISIEQSNKTLGKFEQSKVACLMSHVFLWEKLVNDPLQDNYLILEDDALVNKYTFYEQYNLVLADLKSMDWDFVFLYIHPNYKHQRHRIPGKRTLFKAAPAYANVGYLLSKQGAKRLLSWMLPAKGRKDYWIQVLIKLNLDLERSTIHTQNKHPFLAFSIKFPGIIDTLGGAGSMKPLFVNSMTDTLRALSI